MKYIITLTLSLFFCISAEAQYVDTVVEYFSFNYLKDEMVKVNPKKFRYDYFRIAMKTSDNIWHVKEYDEERVLHVEYIALDDSFKIKDGDFYTYHYNGKVYREGSFYKNNQVGLWRCYSSNGVLIDSSRYKSTGMPFHKAYSWSMDGKLVRYAEFDMNGSGAGYETFYNEDSTVMVFGKYVAGHLKDSIWSYCYSNGSPSLIETYDSGKLITYECFDMAGNKQVDKCDIATKSAEPPYDVFQYMGMNSKMPMEAKEGGLVGTFRVYVQFLVDTDGSIKDISILRSSHEFFNKEALRIVSILPKWKPCRAHNRYVKSYFILPVTFKLE